jgi:CheY-like chemotaxis protein
MALPATPAAPALDAAAARRPLRVLVAEDNPVNQLVAEMMLRSLGCSAVIAADGEKALEQLAAGAFDLVLMDMQMPVMDGLEATRRLRAREAATGAPRLPVVALTANAMAENRAECLASGMDQFLPKPIRIDELQAMLARWRS